MIEKGGNALTEKNIRLICMIFNVSEDWLRAGNGEMLAASPYEKEFFEIYGSLLPETQKTLLRLAKDLLATQEKLSGDSLNGYQMKHSMVSNITFYAVMSPGAYSSLTFSGSSSVMETISSKG